MNFRNFINGFLTSKLSNLDKKNSIIENDQLQSSSNSEEALVDYKLPKKLGENTYLHSADNFGKMESGRVL